jgi:predicted RNA-binding Zn ribbon-like protein
MARDNPNRNSPWNDGFLFVGNQLALDFLNTRPVLDGEPTELLPDLPALLHWFAAARLLTPQRARVLQQKWERFQQASRALETMRELREKLRKDISAWERTGLVSRSTIADLNRLMCEHPMLTRLMPESGAIKTERWFDPQEPSDLVAPVAEAAANLFAQADHRRVRQCGHCVLHFQDTSKKGTRRWCSMQLCGNRLKVAAYAERQRL